MTQTGGEKKGRREREAQNKSEAGPSGDSDITVGPHRQQVSMIKGLESYTLISESQADKPHLINKILVRGEKMLNKASCYHPTNHYPDICDLPGPVLCGGLRHPVNK